MRLLAAAVLVSSSATAAAPLHIHDVGDGSSRAIQPVPPVSAATTATTRTLYLNRHGGSMTPGNNNSQTDTSSLVNQPRAVSGWQVSDADWAETVACVQQMWAPFDVEITDRDPGATPHVEVHVGGSPAQIGFPGSIGGVSPMAVDCSIIERSIVFVFPGNLGNRPQSVCEVIGQEVGHSFGLDHELEASDPMTYLPFHGDRTFRDKTVACGEGSPRPCGFDGFPACRAQQNSYQLLRERLGEPGTDHVAPTIDVVEPRDQQRVEPGFPVVVHAADASGVSRITLFVDGGMVAAGTDAIAMSTDPELAVGPHELRIDVVDTAGNLATRRLDVTLEDDATAPTSPDFVPTIGCAASRDGGWLVVLGVVGLAARRRRGVRSSGTCARSSCCWR